MRISSLFKPTKYEFIVLISKDEYVNEKSSKMQDEGWQLAGHIIIRTISSDI